MIIKVCGMREAENIREVRKLGVDWMGLIFHPDSPRYVSQIRSRAGIIPDYSRFEVKQETARGTVDNAEPQTPVKRVGVFVDDMPQNIVTRVVNYKLDVIQLHGSEGVVLIDNLRRTIDPDIHPDILIMKSLPIASVEDIQRYRDYVGHVDYFLFDTKTPLAGGSGKQFDWSVLEAYDGDIPFMLSGGIGPEDVDRIKAIHHPMFAGIDLNSKFETEPAVKDVRLLGEFIEKIKTQNNNE